MKIKTSELTGRRWTGDRKQQAVGAPLERVVRPARGDKAATYDKGGVTAWKCLQCDREHTFDVYVAAHMRVELAHTCTCGAEHSVLGGQVRFERAAIGAAGARGRCCGSA